MAYFTDAFEIAERYSQDKEDTSQESLPYEEQFRIKTAEGADIPLYKHWTRLSLAKRQEIAEKAKHITQDDDGNIIYDETEKNGLGNFAYHMKEAHGNAIRALEEGWLNDGTLYQEEERFLEVLKLAGVEEEGLFYADPNFTAAGVFSVFMAMKNPFNTTEQVTKGFLRSLRAAAKKAPKAENPRSFNLWDKKAIEPMDFVARVERDIEKGTTHAWTAIPDWVTAFLVSKGYDGIQDEGGKHYEAKHTVYIPFEPTQIKSVDNNGNFSADDPNIYHQANGGRENNFTARQEKGGEKENKDSEEKFIDTFLKEKLPEDKRAIVEAKVNAAIEANLERMTPDNITDIRDAMPILTGLRSTYLNEGRLRLMTGDVEDVKNTAALLYGYARRFFDNDGRTKRFLVRHATGGRQGSVHRGGEEVSTGYADRGLKGDGRRGIPVRENAEYSEIMTHFKNIIQEAKKHSEKGASFHTLEQSAWHGSPHIFDYFSLDAIGTGEGAQAHG